MTREEAIKHGKEQLEVFGGEHREFIEMTIKALEHSCEDAVSRQAVLSKIKEVCFSEEWLQFRVDNGSNGQRDFLINYIENLPSVTPTRKKGKWIKIGDRGFGYTDTVICECSECGNKKEFRGHFNGVSLELRSGYNYCPNCGAEMESER